MEDFHGYFLSAKMVKSMLLLKIHNDAFQSIAILSIQTGRVKIKN